MINLARALERLQNAELELALELAEVGDRHAFDRDVFHACQAFQHECQSHVKLLRPFAVRYRVLATEPAAGTWPSLLKEPRRPAAWTSERQTKIGLLLLLDLRRLYHQGQEVRLFLSLIEQVAQSLRDRELADGVSEMHGQTQAQLRWIEAKLQALAPRVLLAG